MNHIEKYLKRLQDNEDKLSHFRDLFVPGMMSNCFHDNALKTRELQGKFPDHFFYYVQGVCHQGLEDHAYGHAWIQTTQPGLGEVVLDFSGLEFTGMTLQDWIDKKRVSWCQGYTSKEMFQAALEDDGNWGPWGSEMNSPEISYFSQEQASEFDKTVKGLPG